MGNRKCPSDHFSMAMLTILTAELARKWRFERVPESRDSLRVGITLHPDRMLLRATPR